MVYSIKSQMIIQECKKKKKKKTKKKKKKHENTDVGELFLYCYYCC